MRAARSIATRSRRDALVVPRLAFAAHAVIALGCSSGAPEPSPEPRADFADQHRRACVVACLAAHGDATCEPYCACEARELEARGHLARARELTLGGRPSAIAQEPFFAEVYVECGADHADHTLVADCAAGCPEGAPCDDLCRCVLGRIRQGRTRPEGTRWIFDDYARDPQPPEVVTTIDSAMDGCAEELGLARGAAPDEPAQ
jgi:hypothetical protein